MITSRIAPLLLGLLTLTACNGTDSAPTLITDIPFRADGVLEFHEPNGDLVTRIAIEYAVSDSAQARGLMDRRSLPAKGGMIFVDDTETAQEFWMRSTPLPLDVIFIRADSTITNIVKRTIPYSDDRIKSVGKAMYVVEVRAGFTDRMGIKAEQKITWRREEFNK